MYLENDILLSERYPNVGNAEELITYLKGAFEGSIESIRKTSETSGPYTLLSFLCGYITNAELSQMVGPYFSDSTVSKMASRLIARHGALDKFKLSKADFGYTCTAYHLTDEGYSSFLTGIDPCLIGEGVNQKKRTKKLGSSDSSVVPMHDYGVGISLLSLAELRTTFTELFKEKEYTGTFSYNKRNTIRVDANVELANEDGERTVFLEQDMGTEGIVKLCNKILGYSSSSRFLEADKNVICLSCHFCYGGTRDVSLNAKELGEIDELLRRQDFWGVYECYYDNYFALDSGIRGRFENFLRMVDVCDVARDSDGRLIRISSDDFSYQDLEHYIVDYNAGANTYITRRFNAYQMFNTKGKLAKLFSYLERYLIADGEISKELCRPFVDGCSIIVSPSTLLSNSAAWILPWNKDNMNKYLKAVSLYYPDIDTFQGTELSEPYLLHVPNKYYKADNPDSDYVMHLNVRFRNCFTKNGETIIFEHIGKDLNALIRICLLCRNLQKESVKAHVITLCDCYEDILNFASVTEPYINTSFVGLSFLIENGISSDGKACLLTYDGRDEKGKPVMNVLRECNGQIASFSECHYDGLKTAMEYRISKYNY